MSANEARRPRRSQRTSSGTRIVDAALALAHQQQDRGAVFEVPIALLSHMAFPDVWPDHLELAEYFSTYARDGISPPLTPLPCRIPCL